MKTIEEIKDDVANELIYSRPSNYTFKGWSNWKRYFYPSAKELEEAWGKVSERYANEVRDSALQEAAEKIDNDIESPVDQWHDAFNAGMQGARKIVFSLIPKEE